MIYLSDNRPHVYQWDAVVNQSPAHEETGNKIYWSEIKEHFAVLFF